MNRPTAALLAAALLSGVARADSFIGDAGHFFCFTPDVLASNPDGRAFSATVHRHVWAKDEMNQGDYQIAVLAPDGKEVAKGTIPSGEAKATLQVPAGAKGVYRVHVQGAGYALTWVECTLERMVVGCGDWAMKDGPYRTLVLHAMAPRRWYFFVPRGVVKFQVKHTIFPFQSHREDYGFFVMSPRGQRMTAFFGGKPLDVETKLPNDPIPVVKTIETDPGTTGRFWSIWACGGDSHNFSDLQILLDGVPPCLAPSPEQWFDPATGKAPEKLVYDDSQVRLLDERCTKRGPDGRLLSRDHYLWTPATFLGDEDYNGMRGPATIYLSNPENRPIDFGTCSYIVNERARVPVAYRVAAPSGRVVLEKKDSFAHRDSSRITIPASGAGAYRVDVDCAEWFAWTEPAVPMVLAGKAAGGGSKFALQVGIARHWFFRVPEGTRRFGVALEVADPDHVLAAEVHAPDRLVESLTVRGGSPRSARIDVPRGLDGTVWFLRLEVGSATRFVSEDVRKPTRVRIDATIELSGVPGYLAPTWEQWFEPPAPSE